MLDATERQEPLHGSTNLSAAEAVAALAQVRDGVLTGEGPTTRGRIHFSRTIDAQDVTLCRQILLARPDQAPLSREELDALFAIHEAGAERDDAGAFDALFTRAILHFVLASCGQAIPGRATALGAETSLDAWAGAATQDASVREQLRRIAARLNGRARSSSTCATISAMLAGKAGNSDVPSLRRVFDFAA